MKVQKALLRATVDVSIEKKKMLLRLAIQKQENVK